MKKLIIIVAGVIVFLIIAILFAINVLFFREITPSVRQAAQAPVVAEEPVLNAAIPSSNIPTSEEITGLTDRAVKKRRVLEEREAEAERTRTINRAEALAQLKAQESAPPSPAPAKIETQPPTTEELKELEKKGIVSY